MKRAMMMVVSSEIYYSCTSDTLVGKKILNSMRSCCWYSSQMVKVDFISLEMVVG